MIDILINKYQSYGLKKFFFLFLYRFVLKHLPASQHFLFGKMSKKLRYLCCKRIFKFCGQNVNIEKGANFGSGFNLEIGDYSGIGINCRVPSNIIIGKYVMMGPECYILDANHSFDKLDVPMMFQGHVEKKNTIVEDNVWIGREVLFTPGRILRKGSIVGARCLLSRDFPEYSIIGGNPSVLIKTRVNG